MNGVDISMIYLLLAFNSINKILFYSVDIVFFSIKVFYSKLLLNNPIRVSTTPPLSGGGNEY